MMNTTYTNTEYALKYSVTYVAYVNTISEYLWTPLDTFFKLNLYNVFKVVEVFTNIGRKVFIMLFSFDP